ncbi:kelch-like protein 30 [Exaiptasia diaphana]|uniref:BTB domain-containing protein n=1 Tax=Exaiptasia diaphana TaxID=2652724 RepID=A0A913X6B6_EXADI|nr:kelch-like protein 30 [Exaiptasia diaphana]XP_020899580.1 kelch-like protein 30 [Exaiptasia diaphana]
MQSDTQDHQSFDFSSPWHFSDVVLIVEDTKFHVHKSTLSMWSPVFERMFTSEFAERTAEEIPLPGKHVNEVEVLLKLIYSYGKVQTVSDENYHFLLELAEEYQMEKVRAFCSEYLSYNIQESNSIHYYKIADRFNLKDVMILCIEEARYRTSLIMEDDQEFEELRPEVKLEICIERIKELERTLNEYAKTCSSLVEKVYKEVADSALAAIECDNHPVHRTGSREPFKMSCKCCRRRVQNVDCVIQYSVLREMLKKLFDLEHSNRIARRAKNSID